MASDNQSSNSISASKEIIRRILQAKIQKISLKFLIVTCSPVTQKI